MKIGIIVTNFGRERVLEIFAAGIERLREETNLEIPCVCAGDIGGSKICEEAGIEHIQVPNRPLTGKFNEACRALKGRVDAVMIMGSDNLISTKAFLAIKGEMEKGIDLVGLSDIYFFGMDDIYTGKLVHFKYTTVLGVGRTISSRVLDNMHWKPWRQDRDRSIDTVMLASVQPFVRKTSLLSGHFCVDLKTSMNLNSIRFWYSKLGHMPSNQLLWDNIGKREEELIRKFIS